MKSLIISLVSALCFSFPLSSYSQVKTPSVFNRLCVKKQVNNGAWTKGEPSLGVVYFGDELKKRFKSVNVDKDELYFAIFVPFESQPETAIVRITATAKELKKTHKFVGPDISAGLWEIKIGECN